MSLVKSIQRGINSATYNPEAEKALREERKKANEKRTEFRDGLYKLRDVKTDFIDKKLASPWYVKNMDNLIKDGFDWLKNNPDAEVDQITDQASLTKDKWAEITKANETLIKVFSLTNVMKVNRDVLVKEKKINKETEAKINEFIDYAVNFSTKSLDLTPEQVLAKYAELEDKTLALRDVININLRNPEKQVKEAEKTKEKLEEEDKADKETFNVKRLVTETSRIAAQVVGSLFIVMLFLVSGMLTANDAIGRDPQYRILYFVYGGLGFPILLIYYLYRWFFNSAPHIYRLLPLFTKEADTTLGRFLWFPFTYKEDQSAIDAKTKFMTEAAELVGKTYTPPAEKLGQNLEKFITKIQDLTLAPSKEVTSAVKGANTILKGLEKLELGK